MSPLGNGNVLLYLFDLLKKSSLYSHSLRPFLVSWKVLGQITSPIHALALVNFDIEGLSYTALLFLARLTPCLHRFYTVVLHYWLRFLSDFCRLLFNLRSWYQKILLNLARDTLLACNIMDSR